MACVCSQISRSSSTIRVWRFCRFAGSFGAQTAVSSDGEGHVDGELAADPDDAAHRDAAAHEPDEVFRDGQAEPGAAEHRGGGGVHLLEGVEDAGEVFLRDAAAGVVDHEAQLLLIASRQDHADVQRDLALGAVNFTALPSTLTSTCCSFISSPM
jgi:hypothetical protein